MRISDWSSDVCSSDLQIGDVVHLLLARPAEAGDMLVGDHRIAERIVLVILFDDRARERRALLDPEPLRQRAGDDVADHERSEGRRVGKAGGSTFSSRWSPYH